MTSKYFKKMFWKYFTPHKLTQQKEHETQTNIYFNLFNINN